MARGKKRKGGRNAGDGTAAELTGPNGEQHHGDPFGPLRLDRWTGEKLAQHRALLLLAMQDPGSNPHPKAEVYGGRNLGKVVAVRLASRNTVLAWMKRFRWIDRIEAHGTEAQSYAIELYRSLYLEKYGEELTFVADVVSVPISNVAPRVGVNPLTDSQEEAARVVGKLLPPDPAPEVQQAVESKIDKRRSEMLDTNKKLRMAAMSGVLVIQAGIQAAMDKEFARKNPHIQPITPKISDLGRLIQVIQELDTERDKLERLRSGQPAVEPGRAPQETARVQLARETGTSVREALQADIQDAALMLELMGSEDVTLHELQGGEVG